MSLKQYITARYGSSIYKETAKLKNVKIDQAKLKNQLVFLQRCVAK